MDSQLKCHCQHLLIRPSLGAIVATAVLSDCRPTEELEAEISAVERIYGNYSYGRFGWLLTNIRALPEPLPWKGKQGFFNVPDDALTVDGDRQNRD